MLISKEQVIKQTFLTKCVTYCQIQGILKAYPGNSVHEWQVSSKISVLDFQKGPWSVDTKIKKHDRPAKINHELKRTFRKDMMPALVLATHKSCLRAQ